MKILLSIIGILVAAMLGAVVYKLVTVAKQNKKDN